jgi:hypothetical protein
VTLKATVSAKDVIEALKGKFPPNEWALFTEVRSSAGVATFGDRSADALAIGLLPSRGNQIHGFEVKIDRWDFQRELAEAGKADAIGQFCDFWWVVTAGSLAKPSEIPPGWGLMVVQDGKAKIAVGPKQREAKPFTREMLVSLVRSARADAQKTAAGLAAKMVLEEKKKAGVK